MSDDFEKKEKELLATKPEEKNFSSRMAYLRAILHWRRNDGGYLKELKRKRELLATKPDEKDFDSDETYRKALEHWQSNEGKLLNELYDEMDRRSQRLIHEEYMEAVYRKITQDRPASRPRKIPVEEFDDWVM